METRIWCAYNVTRGCHLSAKVTVADNALQPLKVLKVLLNGLALDAETSLWLTPLLSLPDRMRLFPFDLVYLDGDLNVVEAVELHPQVPFPPYDRKVRSALILPLSTLSATGTQTGDQILICVQEELETRLAEITGQPVPIPPPVSPVPTPAAPKPDAVPTPAPVSAPQLPNPIRVGPIAQGTGFTLALSTTWQITNSTVTVALPESSDQREKTAPTQNLPAADRPAPAAIDKSAEQPPSPALPATPAIASPAVTPAAPDRVQPDPPPVIAPAPIAASTQREDTGHDPAEFLPAIEPGRPDLSEQDSREVDLLIAASKEVWEKRRAATPVTPQPAPATAPRKPKKEPARARKPKKQPLAARLKQWLNFEDSPPERRTSTRLLLSGLVAFDASAKNETPFEVRDVSPTGLYLLTTERWRRGDVVSLKLQEKEAAGPRPDKRMDVQAGTVRWGADGIGLSWVLPDGVEFHPWNRLETKRSNETDAEYFLREFRTAKAIGFLRRICPPAEGWIGQALHERFSNKRAVSAVQIALRAEQILAEGNAKPDKAAHPEVVTRILEDGSWAEDEWVRNLWANLLVTSCTPDGQDTSNLVFIDLLDKLTPVHLRILSFACRKGAEVLSAGGSVPTLTVYSTADELIEAAGSQSLPRIHQTIAHLSTMGLLAENARPSYVSVTEKLRTRTTPTELGLKMHARCSGRR